MLPILHYADSIFLSIQPMNLLRLLHFTQTPWSPANLVHSLPATFTFIRIKKFRKWQRLERATFICVGVYLESALSIEAHRRRRRRREVVPIEQPDRLDLSSNQAGNYRPTGVFVPLGITTKVSTHHVYIHHVHASLVPYQLKVYLFI